MTGEGWGLVEGGLVWVRGPAELLVLVLFWVGGLLGVVKQEFGWRGFDWEVDVEEETLPLL